MALQVTISGTTQIYFGGQTALTASVIDTETGQAPAGLQYAWTASDGSFVGATNGASATYHADFTGNTDQTVTITCEVTLPGNTNPTVSAPSLTAMDELGITGQLVNMLVTAEPSGSDLFDRTDDTAIASGSDTNLSDNISITRIWWSPTGRLTILRSGTGAFRDFWDAAARGAYSAYFILSDGTVVDLPGAWIPSNVGRGYMLWEVPSSETAVFNAIDSIATGQMFLFGIADTDLIGLPGDTASDDATVTVQSNAPPVVSITAPQKVNPGDTVPVSVTAVDPEGRAVTVQWGATDGRIDNPTSLNPNFTAPNTSGPVTLTCVATDADGVEGSNTRVIVVNSSPTVVITAPNQLEVGRTGNISIAVSDPNSDAVTIEIETSAGSIDNPTATSTIITAPATPQTITVTCTATDADGLQTVETAQITIVANQPPTLSITVPNALEIGQVGNLRAVTGDPTNDPVTIRWDASAGMIGNQTALNTTITVPATPQTITCTATDDRGAMTTATATITVRQPNRPPTITLNVPATASPGQTVNIEAIVTDPDGDATTGEWRSPKGSIAHPESASTTFTAPLETGIVPLTYEAMNDMGATSTKTAYITVGDLKANIYTPPVRIEIEGVDVTDRRIPRDGLVVGKSLDYPELLTFRSSGISFNLDNEDGAFDYNNPNNFFISNSLPAHGRGATVLVRIGLSQSELIPVFAGEISEVVTRLGDTKANIRARDLSVRSRQKVIENFGIEITRRITDFEDAALDYGALDPVFYFPIWGLPISRKSVSLTVYEDVNDTEDDITIVEAVATEGTLSNQNAEIDYSRGLIRFEAPPDDGIDTQITATWKRDYRYKRPDFLVRQTLKNTGVQDTLQITDDTSARFAIEQALLRHPTDAVFSSHGRPFFEREGIARWMKHNPATDKWLMSIDTRLVEYDEYQDEYIQIATTPTDLSVADLPPGEYGAELTNETITLTGTRGSRGLAVTPTRIYVTSPSLGTTFNGNRRYGVDAYDYNGNRIEDIRYESHSWSTIQDITVRDNILYLVGSRAGYSGQANLFIINLNTTDVETRFGGQNNFEIRSVAVTDSRTYIIFIKAVGLLQIMFECGVALSAARYPPGMPTKILRPSMMDHAVILLS